MDKELLKSVFDTYYEPLCLYSVQFTDDENESEDIVQDLFVRIFEHGLLHKVHDLRSYLYTSVRNASIMAARRYFLREDIEPLEQLAYMAEDEVLDEEHVNEKCRRLMQSVNNLPEKERSVLMEIVVNRKRYRLVAKEMNISVNTVKTHLRRAMQALRRDNTIAILPLLWL